MRGFGPEVSSLLRQGFFFIYFMLVYLQPGEEIMLVGAIAECVIRQRRGAP